MNHGLAFKIFSFICICVFSPYLQAIDSSVIRFNSYDVDDGLIYNAVRAITQDKQGYIWIGTELGLSKFDGSNLTNYQMDLMNGLSGSFVRALTLDTDGNLWIGTDANGLNKYLPATNSFRSITMANSDLKSNKINALVSGAEHFIWIGSDKGLVRFNTENNNFSNFFFHPFSNTSLPAINVKSLLLGRNGDLWVGTSKGLALLKHNSQSLKDIELPTNIPPMVLSLAEDNSGNIWIGTDQGLYFYNKKAQKINKQDKEIKAQIIMTLLIDKSDSLWIGTMEDGVYRVNSAGIYSHFVQDPKDHGSLGDIGLMSLFQDNSGVIWLGTFEGVHWFDPTVLSMGAHDDSLSSFSCLPSKNIFSALSINDHTLMVGTNSGLSFINLENKQCKNFVHTKSNPTTISHNSVISIFRDSNHSLWVGTLEGIDRMNEHSSEFTRYGQKLSTKGVYVNLIKESADKRLILGTSKGIYLSNLAKDQFDQIPSNKSLDNARIYTMAWDHSGNLWVGSNKGLLFIDNKLETIELVYADLRSEFETNIRSLHIKNKFEILISIDGSGLFEFNTSTKTIDSVSSRYNIDLLDGFAGFQHDLNGDLWLMTYHSGLYRFDPDKKSSTHYGFVDGLNSNFVTERSAITLPNGDLFFGSHSGFSLFNPNKIEKNTTPAKVAITNFLLNGVRVEALKNYDGFILPRPIYDIEDIFLNHDNNSLGFEFTAFHYAEPDKNKFAYQLEGVNDNWVNATAGNNGVTFDDLAAGKYIFRVKAASKNNIWSDETSLNITISPAPWLTWWAYIIYAVSAVLFVLFIIYKRTKTLTERAEQLQDSVNQRTAELAKEKQIVEELLSRKNDEFANISHEFRTPLTLILRPIKNLLKADISESLKKQVRTAKRNSYHLLRMVEQLLQMEKFNVQNALTPSPQAVKPIISLIAQSFQELIKEKNIVLDIQHIDELWLKFTPDALEKIILNLLSNAVKYTPSGGTITLNARLVDNETFELRVKDSGIGISPEKQQTIFERFTRAVDEHREKITGMGIGLALVKELVEVHGGSIELKSDIDKGSEFIVLLPNALADVPAEIEQHVNTEMVELELESLVNQQDNVDVNIATNVVEINDAKATILVIEDNVDMRGYIIESLMQHYNCIEAENGQLGIEKALEEMPDLIISDIMMPVMDGYEVSNRLKNDEKTSHIPLILLSARGDKESRLKGWREFADEYITKPFDEEELLLRVANLLSIRELLRQRFNQDLLLPSKGKTNTRSINNKIIYDKDNGPANWESKERLFVDKFIQVLEKRYQDHRLKIAQVAQDMSMTEKQLSKKLKSLINVTPKVYLRTFRLQKSAELIIKGKMSGEVAYTVGFSSHAYFSSCFKAYYGKTPTDFIEI